MTNGRYEIEFQGSNDGQNWTPYLFRNKPQVLNEAPRIYAPYQPRFDWNLWFASLGDWRQNEMVPLTEERLLENDKDVLDLFRGNPFPQAPPRYVRAVLWQYWFTTRREMRTSGNWWKREYLGLYAPELTKSPEGMLPSLSGLTNFLLMTDCETSFIGMTGQIESREWMHEARLRHRVRPQWALRGDRACAGRSRR